jgi:hypothetical protein
MKKQVGLSVKGFALIDVLKVGWIWEKPLSRGM